MGAVNTTYTFTATDTITSTKMNNIIDETTITSDAIIGTTLEIASGKLKVRSAGITSNELASGAVTYTNVQPISSMTALGNVTGTTNLISEVSILDEDNMVSDSATALATQQSIKAYTDTKVSALFVRGTAVATTSGTNIDFTSIPSTVKRITLILSGVSTNGTSPIILQLGDSGGVEITGYSGSSVEIKSTPDTAIDSTGILISPSPASSDTFHGTATILNLSGNVWVATVIGGNSIAGNVYASGVSKTLSATLDRIRLTTTGGVNTFDAGSVNIMYE